MVEDERDPLIEEINNSTYRFTPPRSTFDPINATDEELFTHGLPPRPDRTAYPDLYAFWLRLVEMPLELVNVRFVRYSQEENYLRAGGPLVPSRHQSSRNWSGASVTPRNGQMFTDVTASWHVPSIWAPVDGHYRSSTWIGLDGQRSYLDATLPQIGTAQQVTRSGGTSIVETYAWVQWFPAKPEMIIPTLTFGIHDEAAAYVWVLPPAFAGGPQRVYLYLSNLSVLTTAGIHPYASYIWDVPMVRWPDPVTSPLLQPEVAGGTAEWVMERPKKVGSDELRALPSYDEVVFQNCAAWTAPRPGIMGSPQEFTGPTLIRMDTDGRIPHQAVVVSRAERTGETTFKTTPPPP